MSYLGTQHIWILLSDQSMGVVMVMDTYYSERLESQVWFCGEVVDLRPLGDFIEYLLYVVV